MLSLRRYAVYLILAATTFLVWTHFRQDFVPRPIKQYSSFLSQDSTINQDKLFNEGTSYFQWDAAPVRYPVKNPIPLPKASPRQLPKVQFDFPAETPEQADVRTQRQGEVVAAFGRCWRAYSNRAWMKDELLPLTGGYNDNFGGWAATLVDSLDSLWLMGFEEDFENAVKAVVEIDLMRVALERVNVFETTIRHLGGLLSAYDLSGDTRLLQKAKEFGDMLIVPFDTPNRMPILRWKPREAFAQPQMADTRVLVAEIGSLTMEFTRLSQVTGNPKWFDAVERIMQIFDEQQFKTHLPGMWPISVNAKDKDFTQDTLFTLGAMSDSLYEYLPKMHALLGGVDPKYKRMYDGSMAIATRYHLFRPMTPDGADILVSGSVRASDKRTTRLEPEGQHLVCFAGGMLALGGKLFDEPDHVQMGKKLTDGCIWTYKALPLGIMPELFHMIACEDRVQCPWNETKWREHVRLYHGTKEETQGVDESNVTAIVDRIIAEKRLPKGFTNIRDSRYILRPEAIESVFLLYRMTGERYLLDAAWDMFQAIQNATKTRAANAALSDVTRPRERLAKGSAGGKIQVDSMESFWMAETLKYFYLIFSEPSVVSLDEWVFNTEAHPFRRPKKGSW